jgi:hypothetical protein
MNHKKDLGTLLTEGRVSKVRFSDGRVSTTSVQKTSPTPRPEAPKPIPSQDKK